MNNSTEFFDRLRIPEEKRAAITAKLNEKLSYVPKIGIFGKTGVGKSSLCNALFGQDICKISDVEACTREKEEVPLNTGGKGIILIDVPGVGESQEKDEEYGKLYAELLPELDLVLWLLKADDRAFSSDELFYKNIVKPHIEEGKIFFFVLNQVDKIEPFREWNESKHEPGITQFSNIHKKVEAVSRIFERPIPNIIPVSANEKYNLNTLVDTFLFALPRDKVYTVGRNVKKENISVEAQNHIEKSWFDAVMETVSDVVGMVADVVAFVKEGIWDFISSWF
jgi:small GTP-binding protein